MPELPEVETVRKTLLKYIKDKTIKEVIVYYEPIMPEGNLISLANQTIKDIGRVGKFLLFYLDDYVLISHLRMEGRYFIKDNNEAKSKHEHVKFVFTDGTTLRYVDTRKFGRILIKNYQNYDQEPPISLVAKEPHLIDSLEFEAVLSKRKSPIKVSLLDQHIIAGLGNIYVDETLFLANVLPTRPSNEVTSEEIKLILKSAGQVLKKATALGGTTIYSYESSEGVSGLFQNELLVHTKVGKPCPVCKTTIEKIKVGGRGTYVCFKCQK